MEYDIVLATWWETAPALWQLKAKARAVFLQSLEEIGFFRYAQPTGAVASLIQLFGMLDAEKLLAAGKGGAFTRGTSQVS